MKSMLLTFIGVCATWAITGDLGAQTILGDTKIRAAGERPPVSDALTRKLIQINDVESDIADESVQHPEFNDHSLRITKPKICDPSVRQYSGYMDITSGKHLFFWFFESRNAPDTADFIYWTNGGPGCSSSTGLLLELGPCRLTEDGVNVTRNEYSWNTNSHILFLDQPVNVGFSYSDDGSRVDHSTTAGGDVYVFFQLFFARFPEYASAPFHIASESYGGTYAPHAASIFHTKNKELALTPIHRLMRINLASVILANGLTDPLEQLATVRDYACHGPYRILDPDGKQCSSMKIGSAVCERLVRACYRFPTRAGCLSTAYYCYSQLYTPMEKTGLNLYDVRKKCNVPEYGPECFPEIGWLGSWMNGEDVKRSLGVDPTLTFEACKADVSNEFALQADAMQNSALLLTDLVNEGVRLLVYAGNADAICNYMGNERWVSKFANVYHEEFVASEAKPWITRASKRRAGMIRTAGGRGSTAGNLTFVNVFEAGHMVPYDQPEAALDLIARWILNVPLTDA
ncbi:serine carboxypeptidase [Thelephora ganbajun]|uniref:Serine carboxypeptidase n=1 Tax=Thelephora ganbajun TaxID=370292 RepID=A0ACB6ZY62_THEGA|nr:serine carboxypeptidase [Thelephora ganbajun]